MFLCQPVCSLGPLRLQSGEPLPLRLGALRVRAQLAGELADALFGSLEVLQEVVAWTATTLAR